MSDRQSIESIRKVTGMSKLINICENYSRIYNINFNPSKCMLLHFNKSRLEMNIKLKMNGIDIPVGNEYKHLGNLISTRSNCEQNVNKINQDMNVRTNTILREFSMLNSSSRRFLFNTQCMSLYGCELLDLCDRVNIEKLCVNWRKCCRKIIKVSPRTHCNLIPQLMQTRNILTIVENRILNFLIKNLSHKNKIVNFISNNSLLSISSPVNKILNKILWKHKISFISIFEGKRIELSDVAFQEGWIVNIINEIIDCIEGGINTQFDKELLLYMF